MIIVVNINVGFLFASVVDDIVDLINLFGDTCNNNAINELNISAGPFDPDDRLVGIVY